MMTDRFDWVWESTAGATKPEKLRFQSEYDDTCLISTCSLLAAAAHEIERLEAEIRRRKPDARP